MKIVNTLLVFSLRIIIEYTALGFALSMLLLRGLIYLYAAWAAQTARAEAQKVKDVSA